MRARRTINQTRSIRSRVALAGVLAFGALSLAACGSSSSGTEAATDAPSDATGPGGATSVAVETNAPTSAATTDTATAAASSTADTTATDTSAAPDTVADVADPNAVKVTFDAPKGEPRPINETSQPIEKATDKLSMEISSLTYRGVVCGFTFHGDAPPSPVTIRLHGTTPSGHFDSGKLKVSWTSLDSHTVTSDAAQDGTWNFSSEAHVDRAGKGWVISVGGVTPSGGDDASVTPKRAACELEASSPVFTPANGPVGYWAGYATV